MPNKKQIPRVGTKLPQKPMPKQDKETATGSLDTPKSARHKRETRFDLYPESWTFFKRDSVISGIELDS